MKSLLNNASTTRTLTLGALLAAGLALSGQANAASQCKGLDNAACDSQQSCSWVAGYERSDGRKVNAFCRTKAKRASKSSAVKDAAKQVTTKQQG